MIDGFPSPRRRGHRNSGWACVSRRRGLRRVRDLAGLTQRRGLRRCGDGLIELPCRFFGVCLRDAAGNAVAVDGVCVVCCRGGVVNDPVFGEACPLSGVRAECEAVGFSFPILLAGDYDVLLWSRCPGAADASALSAQEVCPAGVMCGNVVMYGVDCHRERAALVCRVCICCWQVRC